MKDTQETTTPSSTVGTEQPCRPWRNRIFSWTLGVVMGAVAVGAVSQAGFGPGCGRFGHGPWAGKGPEAAEERHQWVAFAIERMLTRVDATDEQKAEIKTIVDRLAADTQSIREGFAADRESMIVMLTGPEIDRDAMEAMRTAQMDRADALSREAVEALADAASVLTQAQREALAERVAYRHH